MWWHTHSTANIPAKNKIPTPIYNFQDITNKLFSTLAVTVIIQLSAMLIVDICNCGYFFKTVFLLL